MTHLGSRSDWINLIDDQVPDILALVVETWNSLPSPAANELEDPVTNRLCAALQRCPNREEYLFRIQPQSVILEPDAGIELGRLDIAFLPFVPSDEIYFCLECKRLNVRGGDGVRPYYAQYVRNGMLRFVSGQYAGAVRHGGMLGYVLNGDVPGAIAGVEDNIRNMRQALGMEPPGGFQPSSIRPADDQARETRHSRAHNQDPFTLSHLFMPGDPNAPMLPEPAKDSASPGGRKKRKPSRRQPRK
jgi:hypothetical protein